MLNPFPNLLMYGLLAPMLIRVAVGAVFCYLAVCHWRGRAETAHILSPFVGKFSKFAGPLLAVIEIITAALLIVGLFTQIAALVSMVLSLKSLILRSKLKSLTPLSHTTYALLFVMALSLLLTGAGLPSLAFDLPL